MFSPGRFTVALTIIGGMLILAGTAGAAPGIRTSMGDSVTLTGYSSGSPYVYLFLTGPNLPVNGVALNDITRRADQGGFTRVSVDGDDRWTYTWHTGSIGGRLDEGTYTIWVVNGPNDRSRLAWADYQTLPITLGKPYVTVDTPVQPGGMNLHSVPEGASLVINGEYRGKTPLTLSNLPSGRYTVTFSRFGFVGLSTDVPVEEGKTAEVTANLQPETGTLGINSTPSGARVLLDGTDAGLSPVMLENISAGNHTVVLEKEGYRTEVREVRVKTGEVTPVELPLEPVPAAAPPATRAAGSVLSVTGVISVFLVIACSGRFSRR
jgi:hypothetical protein